MIDLHFHSHYSDGIYSPKELVAKAGQFGFKVLSLTDHNAIDGIREFLTVAQKAGLKAVKGVEIYTHLRKRKFHLLGYGFDSENKELNSTLKKLQEEKIPRIKKAVEFLRQDGWNLTEEEVFDNPASYLGLVHLANALEKDAQNWERIKKDFCWFPGKIITIVDIIVKYFIKEKKARALYNGDSICPETEISLGQAIRLIKEAGGKAILAHPGEHLSWHDDRLIEEMKKLGLDGIEAISSHHSWQDMEHWQKLAKELDLIITVGSDFHGDLPEEWGFPLNSQWEYFRCRAKQFKDLTF